MSDALKYLTELEEGLRGAREAHFGTATRRGLAADQEARSLALEAHALERRLSDLLDILAGRTDA